MRCLGAGRSAIDAGAQSRAQWPGPAGVECRHFLRQAKSSALRARSAMIIQVKPRRQDRR